MSVSVTRRRWTPTLLVLAATAVLLLAVGACRFGEANIDYDQFAADMPDLSDLPDRATAFRSTRIYDLEGGLLNETFDPNAGRRNVVPLDRIAPTLQQATIATEDANYYDHGGVDPIAVARAAWYLVREGEVVSGASTIPQQLVKRLYLSPERTVKRKVVEAALATEISQQYSKDEILTLYLNEIFYGNLAYGAQAAADTYFGKDAIDLTLAEAALLAGLPQAPAYHDPYANPDRAKARQEVVLGLMVKAGFVTRDEADAAASQPLAYVPPRFDLRAPHFTLFVREQIEALFGREALYSRGLNVYTSLDPALQEEAERAVREHVATLAGRAATNGALVALRPETGEIAAMVGSADFGDEAIGGQINMALAPRQPGSAMKPLAYLAAFESARGPGGERWTPGTLLADIEEPFPDGANPPYVPTNYDEQEHGMVTVRAALANSYNIPAVRTLQAAGLPALLDLAGRLGITTLTRDDYGLSLALGSGEVPLVELAGAYAALANDGRRVAPVAIRKITDGAGGTLCEIGTDKPCLPGAEGVSRQAAIDPIDAFLITDILSDNAARVPAFGSGGYLELDRPAAVKTGTTNDIRDGWTVGYVPQLVTAVWVGNADNTPMASLSGYSAAGPIWQRFMTAALAAVPVKGFEPPSRVRRFEVCADTGTEPSEACPDRRVWWFDGDRPPLPAERDLWQRVRIDQLTGLLATDFTPDDVVEERVYKIFPEAYRRWAEAHGIPQPPAGESTVFAFEPTARIGWPTDGARVSGIVTVTGTADVPLLDRLSLRVRPVASGGRFGDPFAVRVGAAVRDGVIGAWDTRDLANGAYDLRLRVHDQLGHTHDHTVRVYVANRFPTATTTATVPPTPTVAATAVPLVSATPSPLPATARPSATPMPMGTPVPAATATAPRAASGTPLPPSPSPTVVASPTSVPTTEAYPPPETGPNP